MLLWSESWGILSGGFSKIVNIKRRNSSERSFTEAHNYTNILFHYYSNERRWFVICFNDTHFCIYNTCRLLHTTDLLHINNINCHIAAWVMVYMPTGQIFNKNTSTGTGRNLCLKWVFFSVKWHRLNLVHFPPDHSTKTQVCVFAAETKPFVIFSLFWWYYSTFS